MSNDSFVQGSPVGQGGGGAVPTGTGYRHVTRGAEDAAAYTAAQVAADLGVEAPAFTFDDTLVNVVHDCTLTIPPGMYALKTVVSGYRTDVGEGIYYRHHTSECMVNCIRGGVGSSTLHTVVDSGGAGGIGMDGPAAGPYFGLHADVWAVRLISSGMVTKWSVRFYLRLLLAAP